MKTDRLEDFIKANRDAFDQFEPSEKVWENISKTTRKTKKIPISGYVLRIAAVVIFVVSFSVFILKSKLFTVDAQVADPEMLELIEAEAFYAGQVNEKMNEIRKCYDTFPEIKDEVEADLVELQDMYNILKTDLNDNIAKKEVIEAMIENNRNQLKMVDEVLEQIKC